MNDDSVDSDHDGKCTELEAILEQEFVFKKLNEDPGFISNMRQRCTKVF